MEWSQNAQQLLDQCQQLGIGTRCLPVYYERLILNTEHTVRRVLRFLGLPWTDDVLRHQNFVDPEYLNDTRNDNKVILNKCAIHTVIYFKSC